MPTLDPFSAQIVAAVRAMPDEAILELVRKQLGAVAASGPAAPRRRGGARKSKNTARRTSTPASASRKGAPKRKIARRPRQSGKGRDKLLGTIERFVKASKGVALSDVATVTGAPKSRVSAALRALKADGRIARGGDRRFARYAANAKTALAASKRARAGK